jgi:8-oxo-dGTP pyrophosphatase MutT (NUDIX family)
MVHDVFGYWTLSKGGIDLGESPEEGTIREIKEEIGLDITIVEKLGENEYVAHHPEKGKIRKHVHYFLTESVYQPLVLAAGTGGLDQAKWFELSDFDVYKILQSFLRDEKNSKKITTLPSSSIQQIL